MSDDRSDDGDPARDAAQTFDNFGDYARFQAALQANLAEALDQGRRQISAVVSSGRSSNSKVKAVVALPPLDDLLTGLDEAAQRIKLLSSLNAAQAVAWDHMETHGGLDNPEAYTDYGAATEFHLALIADVPGAQKNTEN
jgi:hypothetical protein